MLSYYTVLSSLRVAHQVPGQRAMAVQTLFLGYAVVTEGVCRGRGAALPWVSVVLLGLQSLRL